MAEFDDVSSHATLILQSYGMLVYGQVLREV